MRDDLPGSASLERDVRPRPLLHACRCIFIRLRPRLHCASSVVAANLDASIAIHPAGQVQQRRPRLLAPKWPDALGRYRMAPELEMVFRTRCEIRKPTQQPWRRFDWLRSKRPSHGTNSRLSLVRRSKRLSELGLSPFGRPLRRHSPMEISLALAELHD